MNEENIKPDPLSAEGLANLEELTREYFSNAQNIHLYMDWQEVLAKATQAVSFSTDISIVKTVLQTWVDYFDFRAIKDAVTYSLELSKMLGFVRMVNYHELVPDMVKSMDNRRALAWICLSRTAAHDLRTYHLPLDDIGNLLSTWFGKPEISAGPLTTESVVQLLYGPGVWELCAMDEPDLAKVPNQLYNLGLPVLGPEIVGVRVDTIMVGGELPEDL